MSVGRAGRVLRAAAAAAVATATVAALVACPGPAGPTTRGPVPLGVTPDAGPARVVAPPRAPEPEEPLYPMDEAIADALSGPLVYMGTGPWHGLARVSACAYHNDRVIVVNVYCTTREVKAFRVDILSPARGRVSIYAEAKAPISTLRRAQYFSFKGESSPAPTPADALPELRLAMSFAELQSYDRRRYDRYLPGCFGGVEIHKAQGGCLRALDHLAAGFAARNDPFWAEPPDAWYRLVGELRTLAARDGRAPGR